MGFEIIGNIVSGVTNIADRVSKVFIEERRARARNKLDQLRRDRKDVMRSPCDAGKAKTLAQIDVEIEKVNSYLNNL